MSMRLEKGKPANVVTVAQHGGDYTSIQDAVDAASAGGYLGYKGIVLDCSVTDLMEITAGQYFSVTCKGHPTDPDSTAVYEFTTDGNATIQDAVAIDLSSPMDLVELYQAIVAAVDGTQGQLGNSALNCFNGQAAFDTLPGFAVTDAAAWSYFTIDLSNAPQWSVKYGVKKRATSTQVKVQIYPGTYSGPLMIPENVHVEGINPESCIITDDYFSGVVGMDSNSSLRGIKVVNTAEQNARGVCPNNIFYDTTDVAIENCIVECEDWAIDLSSVSATIAPKMVNLSVQRCKLSSSNPLDFAISHRKTVVKDCVVDWTGESNNCFAFGDDLTVNPVSCHARIEGNVVRLRRTNSASTPYGLTVAGYGHTIKDNTIELVWVAQSATDDIEVFRFGVAALWTGDTVLTDNVLSGNTVKLTFEGADATVISSTIGISSSASGVHANIKASNNTIVPSYSRPLKRVVLTGDAGTPTVITLYDGALNGLNGAADTLSNATVTVSVLTP